jgi:hypothetical protein
MLAGLQLVAHLTPPASPSHDALAVLNPGVMARKDAVSFAGLTLDLGDVLVPDSQMPRSRIATWPHELIPEALPGVRVSRARFRVAGRVVNAPSWGRVQAGRARRLEALTLAEWLTLAEGEICRAAPPRWPTRSQVKCRWPRRSGWTAPVGAHRRPGPGPTHPSRKWIVVTEILHHCPPSRIASTGDACFRPT